MDLAKCHRPPSQGGFTRDQVNDYARTVGVDPSKFRRKEDLCDELRRLAQAAPQAQALPVLPATLPVKPTVRRPVSPRAPVVPVIAQPPAPVGSPRGLPPPTQRPTSPRRPLAPVVAQLPTPNVVPQFTGPMIAAEITKLADYYSKRQGDVHRARAFRDAVAELMKIRTVITDPKRQLKGVPKLGEGTINRIQELVTTGRIQEPTGFIVGPNVAVTGPTAPVYQETPAEQAYRELKAIYGIGDAKIQELLPKGARNVEDVARLFNEGQIDLTAAQRLGVEYYNHFQQRIPRDEVTQIGNYILNVAYSVDANNIGEVVGSYRRGKPTSGDVDILISNLDNLNFLDNIVSHLKDIGLIVHTIRHGVVYFTGTYFSSYPDRTGILRKIDIRYIPIDDFTTAIFHSTGDANFNVKMRNRAIELGMKLSEHELFDEKTGQRVPVETEEDIFRALGLDYVPPEQRE